MISPEGIQLYIETVLKSFKKIKIEKLHVKISQGESGKQLSGYWLEDQLIKYDITWKIKQFRNETRVIPQKNSFNQAISPLVDTEILTDILEKDIRYVILNDLDDNLETMDHRYHHSNDISCEVKLHTFNTNNPSLRGNVNFVNVILGINKDDNNYYNLKLKRMIREEKLKQLRIT